MACSKFEYVKLYEQSLSLLRNTFIVIRVDGHSFHRFTAQHSFAKPNDLQALQLMNECARQVMKEIDDIWIAYGQSDEYSFVFRRSTDLWGRREAKLVSNVCSLFTSNYVMKWNTFFPDKQLQYPPSFDSRAVCYPTEQNIRDYLSWRQADCHINNLYNTTFWALVLDKENPKTEREAEAILRETNSGSKNEILFSQFGINYNNIEQIFRKGTVLFREEQMVPQVSSRTGETVKRKRKVIVQEHCDIISDSFWNERKYLLETYAL